MQTRTREQELVIDALQMQFGLNGADTEGILFLDRSKKLKPWFPYDVGLTIARQSDDLGGIEEHYISYIDPLRQVVHSATVTDARGRTFTRSGVAKIGEKLDNEETPDEHRLAGARALNAALDAAGFNPLKAGSSALELNLPPREHIAQDESASRRKDLKQIHLLAAQKGLIVPQEEDAARNDMTEYRKFLADNFQGRNSAADFSSAERAILINLLRELPEPLAAVA
jgi:hypothetical protein